MLAFIQGQFGDRSVALDGPPHHYPRARRWLLPLLSHRGRTLSWVTSPFHYPRGEDRLFFRKEYPGEKGALGRSAVGQCTECSRGDTPGTLLTSFQLLPYARSTEASGLLLSSQKRLGLGRHRTLALENEGHFQEVSLSLKLALIGGRDPGMTSSCSNLEVSGSVPRGGSREGVGISACIFWCAW